MGGSPKRGRAAAGCMSRGRGVLLAALAVQLLLVACLVKAPRLPFLGSGEEGAKVSWLWWRFGEEDVRCVDGDGRRNSAECESRDIRSSANVSVHGQSTGVPRESRLTRSVVGERGAGRERAPGRNGSGGERLGDLRGRVKARLPVRDGSAAEVARGRHVRPGKRLAAAPVQKMSAQLRISIGDSLERDSFRFRARGGRLRGEVMEASAPAALAAGGRAPALISALVPAEELAEDDVEDVLAEDDSDDDLANSAAAIAHSGTTRASDGSLHRANVTISEVVMRNVSRLEEATNATAPSAQAGARNGTLPGALPANASNANSTLGEFADAPVANASGMNITLGAPVGALNGTLAELYGDRNETRWDAISPSVNMSNSIVAAPIGALNVSLGGGNASTANVTPADAPMVDAIGINATLGAPVGAINVSLEDGALVSRANVTLVARNTTQGDALAANVSSETPGETGDARRRKSVCSGGLIYVYELPKKFNIELLENCSSLLRWGDRCRELSNAGLGPALDESPLRQRQAGAGPWYGTDQFSGEVIFHERLLAHACRTRDPERARAFYIPYYAGLDVARFLFNATDSKFTAAERDQLGGELAAWLARNPYWTRRQGADHFLMLGRITWDFRRQGAHGWGSRLIHTPALANVTKLALERSPWDATEMAVPYPTAFHPRRDADVVAWQAALRSAPRDLLFSFAGASRPKFPHDFRTILSHQCAQAASCALLNCSERKCEDDSLAATRLFTRSTFCLQPRGDSYTRRSIFDSLVAGCIPVFFWTRSAYFQYHWHLPANHTAYSVFIPKSDVLRGASVEAVLRNILPATVRQMQETILALIPRLVYAAPGHELARFQDAFDTTIDHLTATFQHSPVNHTRVITQTIGPIEEVAITSG